MKVTLGKFACFCIEDHFGPDLASALDPALRHYSEALRAQTVPALIPAFLPSSGAGTGGAGQELDIASELADMLEVEARQQRVTAEDLLAHAVFVYVAHLEGAAAPA